MAREQFTAWIKDMIELAGGLRAAGRASGINHTTLLNASNGKDVDLATLELIAKWANVPLSTALDKYTNTPPSDRRVEFEMGRLFTQYPKLRKTLEVALEHLNDEDLRDVINFIEYKAAQRAKQS